MAALQQRTLELIRNNEEQVLTQWQQNLAAAGQGQDNRISSQEVDAQLREFWRLFLQAISAADVGSLQGQEWQGIRRFLEDLSTDRARRGFNSSETASFIFSLKRPLFAQVQAALAADPQQLYQLQLRQEAYTKQVTLTSALVGHATKGIETLVKS